MRTIVNLARIVLVFASVAASGASSLAADPVTSPVPAGTCTIEPRSPEEYAALTGTLDPDDPSPPRDGGRFHDSIPTGVHADETTAATITNVLAIVVACVNARDTLRLFALYTDQFIYAHGPISGETLAENMVATPVPSPPDEWLWIDRIHSIEVLPDARISAVAAIGGINEIDPYPGKTFVFIFAMTSDGWRIDDQYDEILPPDGTAPVSVEEYLAS